MFASWMWTDREHWMWITPIALSINFLLLTYDQVLSFKGLESLRLEGQDPYGLLKTVHALCVRFQIPEPSVFLIPHPSALAFAYARTKRSNRLFVSEGTLRLLTRAELEAVLTFQLLAINNSLSILNYWAGAWLDLVYRLGLTVEKALAFVLGWSPRISVWVIRPFMWLLQFLLMSKRDFQRLDSEVAARFGHAEDLASALWKMESYAQTRPFPDAWVFAHMCIVSPLDRASLLNSIHVQPPLNRRIKHLVGRYPL
jgi:Zn-dependent protease with chaperone function